MDTEQHRDKDCGLKIENAGRKTKGPGVRWAGHVILDGLISNSCQKRERERDQREEAQTHKDD